MGFTARPRPEHVAGAGKPTLDTPNTGGRGSGRVEVKKITSKSPPPWMADGTSGTWRLLPWHQVPQEGGVGSCVTYIVLED